MELQTYGIMPHPSSNFSASDWLLRGRGQSRIFALKCPQPWNSHLFPRGGPGHLLRTW